MKQKECYTQLNIHVLTDWYQAHTYAVTSWSGGWLQAASEATRERHGRSPPAAEPCGLQEDRAPFPPTRRAQVRAAREAPRRASHDCFRASSPPRRPPAALPCPLRAAGARAAGRSAGRCKLRLSRPAPQPPPPAAAAVSPPCRQAALPRPQTRLGLAASRRPSAAPSFPARRREGAQRSAFFLLQECFALRTWAALRRSRYPSPEGREPTEQRPPGRYSGRKEVRRCPGGVPAAGVAHALLGERRRRRWGWRAGCWRGGRGRCGSASGARCCTAPLARAPGSEEPVSGVKGRGWASGAPRREHLRTVARLSRRRCQRAGTAAGFHRGVSDAQLLLGPDQLRPG